MKARLKFHPDLRACQLEVRLVPVTPNLGAIVLTTSGYVLMVPSAGGAANLGGSSGGTVIPTSFAMTGSGGISNIQPGDVAGLPNLISAATTVSNGSPAGTVAISPGANDPNAAIIPVVSRNTIANDLLRAPVFIGRVFGDHSPILPPGEFYRGGLPVTAPATASTEMPGPQARLMPAQGALDPPGTPPLGALPRLADDASGYALEALAYRRP
jgi:hypothetical protein